MPRCRARPEKVAQRGGGGGGKTPTLFFLFFFGGGRHLHFGVGDTVPLPERPPGWRKKKISPKRGGGGYRGPIRHPPPGSATDLLPSLSKLVALTWLDEFCVSHDANSSLLGMVWVRIKVSFQVHHLYQISSCFPGSSRSIRQSLGRWLFASPVTPIIFYFVSYRTVIKNTPMQFWMKCLEIKMA